MCLVARLSRSTRFVAARSGRSSSGRVFQGNKSSGQQNTNMAAEKKTLASTALILNFLEGSEEERGASLLRGNTHDLMVLSAACASMCRNDRHKIQRYVESVVPRYLPDDFKRMFRVSRETFESILQHLAVIPQLTRRQTGAGRQQVSLEKYLLMFIWYIGSQESLKSISDRFNVQESTLINHNRRLLDAFSDHLCKKFIYWPQGNERQTVIDAFQEKRGFPGVLGAMDVTHVSITAPGEDESDYINRKGFHSVILQAICQHDRAFTDIYCGWAGRVHDARVYRNSPFASNQNAHCGQNHIIGDGAYPLSRFLMKPYRDMNLTNAEKQFNKSLSGTRSVIENAFGILKGRFRRLQHVNMKEMEYIVKTIVAACVLHNICILQYGELDEYFQNDPVEVTQDGWQVPAQDAEGALKRLLITRQFAHQ